MHIGSVLPLAQSGLNIHENGQAGIRFTTLDRCELRPPPISMSAPTEGAFGDSCGVEVQTGSVGVPE